MNHGSVQRRSYIKIMHALKITHIQQPPDSNLCGQCCVAMVARVPLEDVIAVMGTRGRTRTRQVAAALRHYGFSCPRNSLTRIHPSLVHSVDFTNVYVQRCILKVLYPWAGDMKDMRGHWVLIWDGVVHDPAIPDAVRLCGKANVRRITSYLPFNRWVEFS